MHGRHGLHLPALLVLTFLLIPGCEPAARYRGAAPSTELQARPFVPPDVGWFTDPIPPGDVPIVFVDAASQAEEWAKLPEFWNPVLTGRPTIHIGLSPLEAVLAIGLTPDDAAKIKIKVPLGLPDPTPNIPSANPPTLAKWALGKKLFFANDWLSNSSLLSCADCHRPDHGFTKSETEFNYNVLSLMNSAYNRHQFWDGRANALEQTLARKLDDERATSRPDDNRHIWTGVIERLRKNAKYYFEFQRVFGSDPSQDNLGKALATYVRTILSGNSVFDQAEHERQKSGAKTLEAAHFEPALTPQTLKALGSDASAREILKGYELFHGKARCSKCHPAPLFTDHDFHNLGIRFDDRFSVIASVEVRGRFVHAPIGLKERRLIGAYRTPTLRALPRTEPYFNNGGKGKLADVLKFYDRELDALLNSLLDPLLLKTPNLALRLELDEGELRALEMFLRSLDGSAIPTIISGVEKKQ